MRAGATSRVLPLYLVVFIGFVGYSLMITVFTPLILREDGGMLPASASLATRTLVLGGVLAVYPLAQFVGSPILGALSDRFGRRPVLLASLGASTALYGLLALALDLESLPLLVLACLLAGLSEANIAIAQSAIADVSAAADRGRLFGYVYLSSSLAYVVGPLGGGKLADPGVVSWFGYPIPFLAVAALLLATLALTAARFRETHRPDRGTRLGLGRAFANVGAAFAPGRLRPLFLGNFVLYLAIFGFFRVYPMYLVDHFGMGVSRESSFIAWVAVPIVISNLGLVAWLSRRLDPRRLTVRFGIALAICLALVVIPHPEGALWATLFACSLALAVCLPSMAAMISAAVGAGEQGSALGSNQSLQVGAEGVSGLAGGGLAAISTALPLPAMGALALLGAGLLSRPRARRAAAEPGAARGVAESVG
ncbi:MAG TPA: MFS transporter [Solirubrobacterales bacterium]|nr:MFS transporter [Solirubrobacterales bacterium]